METLSIGAFYPFLNQLLGNQASTISNGGKVLELLSAAARQLSFDEEIVSVSVFLLLLVVVSTIFGFFAESFATWHRYRLFATFLNKVFYKLLNNDYAFFLSKKQGDLLYIGLNASESVGEMLLYFPKISIELFRLLTISVFLLTISYKATFVVFCAILLFSLFIHFLSVRVIHPIAISLQESQTDVTAIFSESIAGIKQIKIMDTLAFWYNRFAEQSSVSRVLSTKNVVYSYMPTRLVHIVGVFSVVAAIIYVKAFLPGRFLVVVPLIAVYVLALQRLMPSISNIGNHWMGLKSLGPRLETTYLTLMDRAHNTEDGGMTFAGLQREIRIENVIFSYPGRSEVLRNITLTIPREKTVAIVGESGSGKSTLADVLIRLYEPKSGRILIDGTDYREFQRSSWLRRVGLVSQDTFIFHASVRENIKIGWLSATEEEMFGAAKTAHAHQFITELPQGYDTVVGDRGVRLSGGQRQRLAIARAIIRNPDILLLDEATSALDNISEKIVQDALQEAKKNKTTIIIAHRLSTVEHADNIVVMRKGEVVEQGTHEELIKSGGHYHSLYQKQRVNSKDEAAVDAGESHHSA